MTKQFTKSIALALATITISLPFGSQALAASHNDSHKNPPQKVEWRHDRHKEVPMQHRHPVHRPEPKQEKHHSATGNFVTGAIVGGILGAILAKNT